MAKKEEKVVNNKKSKKEEKNKRHFFKDFKAELKKVVWPTPKQLLNSTVAVITIVLVTAVIVFVLDISFNALNEHGINKLQTVLKDKQSTVEENTISEENHDHDHDHSDDASSKNSTTENVAKDAE